MTSHTAATPLSATRRPWATSSFEDGVDTTPGELSSLGAHVDRCNGSRGRWFKVQCAADWVLGFVTSRFVTTVVVIALVFGIVSIVA